MPKNLDTHKKSSGLSSGFNRDIHSILEKLTADDETDFYIVVSDNYILEAIQKYFKDNNFKFKGSTKSEYLLVNMDKGTYKFVEGNTSDIDVLSLPIDWGDFRSKVDSYLEENPIEVEEKPDINPEDMEGDKEEVRAYFIDSEYMRYYKAFAEISDDEGVAYRIVVYCPDNNVEIEIDYQRDGVDDLDTDSVDLSEVKLYDKPMYDRNGDTIEDRKELKFYSSDQDGLLKSKLEQDLDSSGKMDELEEKGYAILDDGSIVYHNVRVNEIAEERGVTLEELKQHLIEEEDLEKLKGFFIKDLKKSFDAFVKVRINKTMSEKVEAFKSHKGGIERLQQRYQQQLTEKEVEDIIDSFVELSDEVKEAREEFKQEMGYEIGDEFLFSIVEDINDLTAGGNKYLVYITPKSYWDKNGHISDQHTSMFVEIPKFEEISESTFVTEIDNPVEIINQLILLDFKFDPKMQDSVEASDGTTMMIMGTRLIDYIKQHHPDSIV